MTKLANNNTNSGPSNSGPPNSGLGDMWLTVLLWLVLMVGAIIMRPILPIDETRYLTVAWEMHTSGSYLVPHLNGELYSHKPPLLFWLMNAGWAIFGVSAEWGRMVAPLFGLGSLWLTAKMANALWPDAGKDILSLRRGLAPLILLSGVYWSVFSTMTMFDMMLAFSTLVSLLGVVGGWRAYVNDNNSSWDFWKNVALIGIGLGLGGLSKGPAILLHVLPVYIFAPFWGPLLTGKKPTSWVKWYTSIPITILIGVGITLGWAIPAAIVGGPEYRDAIFVGQTAGRMVKSFAHQRPPWWFLQYLPLLLLPWFAWPRLWRAVGFKKSWNEKTGFRASLSDGGVRFLIIWFGVTLVAFSAISGKQLHYLLPEFPAIALFAGFLLSNIKKPEGETTSKRKHMVPALVLAGLSGIILLAWAALPIIETYVPRMPSWAYEVAPIWMVPALLLALGAAFVSVPDIRSEVRLISITAASLIVFTHMMAAPALRHAYDLSFPARLIADWQNDGKKMAYVGKYNGEFHFLGRLEKPLLVLPSMSAAIKWAAENPDAIVIDVVRKNEIKADPIAFFPYRGKYLVMWESRRLKNVK